jgi:chromosome segregation ATPase
VEELEKQRKLVVKLSKELDVVSTSCEDRKTEMEAIKLKWLPPLRELAASISENFERLFQYMKCVGEVVLVEGQPNVSTVVTVFYFIITYFILRNSVTSYLSLYYRYISSDIKMCSG